MRNCCCLPTQAEPSEGVYFGLGGGIQQSSSSIFGLARFLLSVAVCIRNVVKNSRKSVSDDYLAVLNQIAEKKNEKVYMTYRIVFLKRHTDFT